MNLARVAIAVADHLIPLSPDQRESVIVRALCLVDDDAPAPVVSAGDDVPRPVKRKERKVKRGVVKVERAPVRVEPEPTPMRNGEPQPLVMIPVTPEDYPESPAPARPSRGRVASQRRAASSAIEAAARSIVEVLSGHPEGMTKGALATALNFESMNRRFVAALHAVTHSGRIRAIGVTNARRYFPAIKGA